MKESRSPYHQNVAGDFYVVDGCCTLCGVPGVIAPSLFGGFHPDGSVVDGAQQCWVKRQPQTAAEFDAMIETIAVQELACIRYRGKDAAVVTRLCEVGEGEQID